MHIFVSRSLLRCYSSSMTRQPRIDAPVKGVPNIFPFYELRLHNCDILGLLWRLSSLPELFSPMASGQACQRQVNFRPRLTAAPPVDVYGILMLTVSTVNRIHVQGTSLPSIATGGGGAPHEPFGLETCRRARIESLRAERFTPPGEPGSSTCRAYTQRAADWRGFWRFLGWFWLLAGSGLEGNRPPSANR